MFSRSRNKPLVSSDERPCSSFQFVKTLATAGKPNQSSGFISAGTAVMRLIHRGFEVPEGSIYILTSRPTDTVCGSIRRLRFIFVGQLGDLIEGLFDTSWIKFGTSKLSFIFFKFRKKTCAFQLFTHLALDWVTFKSRACCMLETPFNEDVRRYSVITQTRKPSLKSCMTEAVFTEK